MKNLNEGTVLVKLEATPETGDTVIEIVGSGLHVRAGILMLIEKVAELSGTTVVNEVSEMLQVATQAQIIKDEFPSAFEKGSRIKGSEVMKIIDFLIEQEARGGRN